MAKVATHLPEIASIRIILVYESWTPHMDADRESGSRLTIFGFQGLLIGYCVVAIFKGDSWNSHFRFGIRNVTWLVPLTL